MNNDNSCALSPSIKKGKTTVQSKLFNELTKYFGGGESGRNLAWDVYELTQAPFLMKKLGNLKYDENGEPTIESLNEVINLDNFITDPNNIGILERSIGAAKADGSKIEYNSVNQIIDTITSFNLEHPSVIATISKKGDKYVINVSKRNLRNENDANQLIFNNNLNNGIQAILRRAGFGVSVDANMKFAGLFDPYDAMKTAEGLRTVIRIAKGERGEEAFPEEFSHLIIEGLRNDPFVKRLLNNLTDESVRKVLGEEYENYSQLYENDQDALKREAAAKVLQSHIVGNPISIEEPKSLLERLWNKIKEIFKGIKEGDIDTAILNANKGFSKLASAVMDESIIPLIDFNTLDSSMRVMYKTTREIDRFQKDVEEGLALASKRLMIRQSRERRGGKISDDEVKALQDLKVYITKKQYTKGCLHFLNMSAKAIDDLYSSLKSKLDKGSLEQIRSTSKTLREIKEFSEGYSEIIKEMKSMPTLLKLGKVNISEEDAEKIAEKASQIDSVVDNLMTTYKEKRYDVLLRFLQIYYGEEKLIDAGSKKGERLSVVQIMEMADHDINFLDRLISSMSDASDPILSIVDKVVKTNNNERDDELRDVVNEIRTVDRELRDAGYTTDFMFERDADGKLTGNYISDIDFLKYRKEKAAYRKELEKQGLSKEEIRSKLLKWDKEHTEVIHNPFNHNITEVVPSRELYKSNAVSKLSKAQQEYYHKMIAFKQRLQTYIPQRYGKTYRAVQIPTNIAESISVTDPKTSAKTFFSSMKDKFVRREFDLDYGEDMIDEPTRRVILDFSGNPLQKLPVYFTGRLKDMSRLSTDNTSSMIAFASMALNYSYMSDVIDALELLRDFIKDREVQQKSGDTKLKEAYTVLSTKFGKPYTKSGKDSNIGKRIDDYYESVIYEHKKLDQGSIKIPGTDTEIDIGKALDEFKNYTGIVGLGLNIFSGISNVTVGKMQLWIEAIGSEYFGVKDLVKARAQYYNLLAPYLSELHTDSKVSKMGLLIERFDALEEFYNNLRETKYKGPLRNLMGNATVLFMQNMGEHYLHSGTMFAILNHKKVLVGNKETSLYDALDIDYKTTSTGKKVGGTIIFKDGAKLSDGTELFSKKHVTEWDSLIGKTDSVSKKRLEELKEIRRNTDKYLNKVKLEINKVNQSLNGAFNERDKGAIHRNALGRLVMQFRQWMPAHYYRRFAGTYYDAQLDQWREGYYRTVGRFILNALKDIKDAKFQIATNWSNLSNHEKANMRRALAEMTIFATLAGLIALLGPVKKDDDKTWADRMIQYQLRRMYLEAGASIPITTDFFKNITTMLQSPAAAVSSFNNVASLLAFWNIFDEIESGRYKGMSEYERDLIKAAPIYGQVRKAFDLNEETYMFNIFEND